jgi:hypothetical protein
MAGGHHHRIVCEDCDAVLFFGPPDEAPTDLLADVPSARRECPRCRGRSRRVELEVHETVEVMEGLRLAVTGKTRHSRKHRATREVVSETRIGRDRRKVHRVMENVRDHNPPFKWHRVGDAETGEVIKNQLIDHSTGHTYDFRDPGVEVPTWFPYVDPRP